MTLTFDAGTAVQADQTVGVQTTDGDTDVLYGDPRFSTLKTAVSGAGYLADTTYADTVAGAYSASAMTVTGTSTVSGIKFVDASGGTLNGDASGLTTADGQPILLYASADGSIVYGVYTVGGVQHLAFATQMNVAYSGTTATVSLTTLTYAPIAQPDETNADETVDLGNFLHISASENSGFDFSALNSTRFLFGVVGNTSGGFVVIGKDPELNSDGTPTSGTDAGDLINTSQGGGGVTIGVDNQQFNGDTNLTTAEEGAYFTYVTGMTAGTYNDADLLTPSALIEVDSARLQISQTQGGGTQAMRITTLNYGGSTDGRDFVGDLNPADQGTTVKILTVTVDRLVGTDVTFSTAGKVVGQSYSESGLTFVIRGDGTVDVIGLTAKDWVSWTTQGLHDRVLIEALSGKWDIGAFEVNQLTTQTSPIGGQVIFADDAPVVDLALDGTLTVTLDESTGADAADANADDGAPLAQASVTAAAYLSTNSASAGTDGAAASGGNVWALSTEEGADSGLIDVATGDAVFFYLDGGDIVGLAGGPGGDEVLRFEIGATGTVTVTQSRALAHPDGALADEAVTLDGTGLVVVTRTLTDKDDDSDSDSVDLTGIFSFEDDAPKIDTTNALPPTLTTGDSDFAVDASQSFAGLFTTPDYGSDGPAGTDAPTYALDVKSDGIDSGLVDTESGEHILLRMNGGTVEGYTALGDEIAFTITVDAAGVVTLDQKRAVVHDDPNDSSEASTPAGLAAADLVTLTATVTDDDTDTASATKDIGDAFNFTDDGPTVTLSGEPGTPMVTDDTTLGSDGPTDLSDLFEVDTGNDGGDVAYTLGITTVTDSDGKVDSGLVDSLTQERILLKVEGGAVVGYLETGGDTAFEITVDAETGEVSLSQLRAVRHNDETDGVETGGAAEGLASAGLVTLTATATDGDDDHDAATAEIGDLFRFEDDRPTVTASGDEVPLLVTDDSDLTDTATDSFAGMFTVLTGTDGPSTMIEDIYELGIKANDADTGLVETESGKAILLRMTGGVVQGYLAGTDTVAFTISVDEYTGEVTLEQLLAIRHGNSADPVETGTEAETLLAADLVTLSLTSFDGDGDSDKATVDIGDAFAFEDDGPSVTLGANPPAALVVSDSDLSTNATLGFADLFTVLYGADKEAAQDALVYELAVSANNVDSGLDDTETGNNILLRVVNGVVEGYVQGQPTLIAFTVSVSSTGEVTLDQNRAIVHDNPADPEELGTSAAIMTIAGLITLHATATDGDGDSATNSVDITGVFAFTDDGPTFNSDIDDMFVDFAKVAGPGVVISDSSALDIDTGNDRPATVKITDYDQTISVNGFTLTAKLSQQGSLLQYFDDTNKDGLITTGEKVYFKYQLTDTDADSILDTATFTILDTPTAPTLDYSFRDLPSGQNAFGILAGRSSATGLPQVDETSILVIANGTKWKADGTYSNISPTINTSQGGGPTTIGVGNQMIDPREGVWFTYLSNPNDNYVSGVTGGLSQSEADDIDNIKFSGGLDEVEKAFFKVVQVQGTPKIASLEINAYDVADNLTERALVTKLNELGSSLTQPAEQVTVMTVTYGGFTYARNDGVPDAGIIWQDDGGVTLQNVLAGDTIVFTTDKVHDAALITGVSGKFDIGDYGILNATDTEDFALDFGVTVTDKDGDSATETHTVFVDGTGIFDTLL